MPRLLRTVMAGALGLAAAGLVACGNTNGLLSSDQGSNLGDALSNVSAGVQDGNCARAQSAAASLSQQVSALPSSVSARLRANLEQAASTVGGRALADCSKQSAPAATRPKSTTTDTTPSTSSTDTGPASTSTQPTTPSTPSTPSTGTTPSTNGNGNGGGQGNGGSGKGNGGGQGSGNGGGAPGGGGSPAPGGGGAGTGK